MIASDAVPVGKEAMVAPVRLRAPRLTSLDAYRGLAMVLMAFELLRLRALAEAFPGSRIANFLATQQTHVAWTGCSIHDLIQPSFSFMVGVAMPFSMAGRRAAEQTKLQLWGHALLRALVLVLLGVFLRSLHSDSTNWTFEDTLSQIGLGYPFLFLLGWLRPRAAWVALVVILVGYWIYFAAWPLPPADFDWQLYQGKPWFDGFLAHWNQNGNAAWAFDRWFLNQFPREQEFLGNAGGYSTLSFIPTLGTMILGLIAGRWLYAATWGRGSAGVTLTTKRDGSEDITPPPATASVLGKLVAAGVICLLLGWGLDRLGWCPVVKKIWTPAWVLFSGGWCFLIISGFYLVADVWGRKSIFFPLTIVGMNSIAMYVLVDGFGGFTKQSLLTHFGQRPFEVLGSGWFPTLHGAATFAVLWLVILWLYRRRIFLRI
jgi:predicted acyltransferase